MLLAEPQADALQIEECLRVLKKARSNVVWEILRQSPPFQQWTHYPKGDVYDRETHSQYFYHAHPRVHPDPHLQENGHFHIFMREKGIPPHLQPMQLREENQKPDSREDPLCHLIAISMNALGEPIQLFTTNRWVTGEKWYPAPAVIEMLDYFNIDHSFPSWPLNLWLSSMIRLYRSEITQLLYQRDSAIAAWQKEYPDKNVYEDRQLEILSLTPIQLSLKLAP